MPGHLPEWNADSESLRELAPPFQIPRQPYQIRPPEYYRYEAMRTPGWRWVGEQRDDGTAAELIVVVMPTDSDVNALKSLMARMLSDRRRDSAESGVESGTIGGVTFCHSKWSGGSTDLRGFLYVGIDDGKMIQIRWQDVKSRADITLPIADAAARTFQRID